MESAKYQRLRLRLMAVIVAFSFVPLFGLGWFINREFNASYREKIISTLQQTAEHKRISIDVFLAERISQLRNLAAMHRFDQMSDQAYLEKIFGIMKGGLQGSGSPFIDLGVIDDDGNQASYVGPYRLKGLVYKDEEWFQKVLLEGTYVSDVFLGFRRFPHFIIAVAQREHERTWILRATIDSNVFRALVQNQLIGQQGDAFLVSRRGELQISSRHHGDVLTPVEFVLPQRFSDVRIDSRPGRKNDAIWGMAWLERPDWLLVVTEVPTEQLSPLFRAQTILVAILFAGFLVVVAGAGLATRFIVERIRQADQQKAEADAAMLQSSKMAALGKMAAGVAHEINNPLTLIRESDGWLKDLLLEEKRDSIVNYDEIMKMVDKIDQHVERARGVTHRMLGFARRMEPTQEDVDINALVRSTATFLESEAAHRNINIQFELEKDMPGVATDTAQVQQVLLNLLENALDAVGRNGSITIASRKGQGEVLLAIADTGQGIPPHLLEKIFDPFFTTKGVGDGTGLGLSISYSIMEKLGGKITVESHEGQGSVFTVHLPLQ